MPTDSRHVLSTKAEEAVHHIYVKTNDVEENVQDHGHADIILFISSDKGLQHRYRAHLLLRYWTPQASLPERGQGDVLRGILYT